MGESLSRTKGNGSQWDDEQTKLGAGHSGAIAKLQEM
jgi:hypothetical protein